MLSKGYFNKAGNSKGDELVPQFTQMGPFRALNVTISPQTVSAKDTSTISVPDCRPLNVQVQNSIFTVIS